MRRALAGLGIVVAAVLGAAAPAAAHAELVGTDPSSGAVLESSPAAIVLTFSEPVEVQPGGIRVFDARGDRVDDGGVERDGSDVVLPVDLDDGGYVVTYRVVSTDGHPIGGGLTFRVGQQAEGVDPSLVDELLTGQGTDRGVGVAAALLRVVAIASLVVLVGGALLAACLWPGATADRRVRVALAAAAVALAAATLVLVGLHAADVAGLGLADAVRPGVVGDVLDGRFALLSIARALLLVPAGFLLVALFRGAGPTAWWRAAAAAVAVGLAVVTALNGHAASGRWQGAALVADVLHLLAGAAWLGGLALVAGALLRRGDDDDGEVRRVVPRFSRLALWAVVVVVATGAFQGLRQVGGLDGLDTTYGRLLLAKVIAVGGLVALAALARQVVRNRLDHEGGVGELRRVVGIEAVVAVVIVGVTALLVDATPARSKVLEPVSASRVVDGVVIDLEVVPAQAGPNDVHLYAQDPAAGLTGTFEATAELSLPGSDLEGIQVPFVQAGRGHWSAYDFDIPIRGEWVLDVRVVRGDSFVEATFDVPIR